MELDGERGEKTRNAMWKKSAFVAIFAATLRIELGLLNLFEDFGVEDW